MNRSELKFFPEVIFGGFTRVDGTVAFHSRVNALLQPSMTVLDCGCGRGQFLEHRSPIVRDMRTFRGKVKHVIGIDVDPVGETNPTIDSFRLIEDTQKLWPLEDNSIDLIVADYVLEHVDNVGMFFSEAARTLKPGGYFCIRTVNVFSYFALASWLARGRMRNMILKAVQENRKEEDAFPITYNCNSKGRMEKAYANAGFDGLVVRHEAEPAYGSNSKLAYFLMEMHRRYAPRVFNLQLFGYGRLKAQSSEPSESKD